MFHCLWMSLCCPQPLAAYCLKFWTVPKDYLGFGRQRVLDSKLGQRIKWSFLSTATDILSASDSNVRRRKAKFTLRDCGLWNLWMMAVAVVDAKALEIWIVSAVTGRKQGSKARAPSSTTSRSSEPRNSGMAIRQPRKHPSDDEGTKHRPFAATMQIIAMQLSHAFFSSSVPTRVWSFGIPDA